MITAAVKHDTMTNKGIVDFTLLLETSNNLINNCTLIMLPGKYGEGGGRGY